MLRSDIINNSFVEDGSPSLNLFGIGKKKRTETLTNEFDQWMGELRSAYPYANADCGAIASWVANLDQRMTTATGAVGERWVAAAQQYRGEMMNAYNGKQCGVATIEPKPSGIINTTTGTATQGSSGGGGSVPGVSASKSNKTLLWIGIGAIVAIGGVIVIVKLRQK